MNIIMQLYVLHTILKTYYTVYFSTVYTQIMTINEQMKYKITHTKKKKRIDVQNKLLTCIWYFFLVLKDEKLHYSSANKGKII